jgi:vesicle-fusing ATPase
VITRYEMPTSRSIVSHANFFQAQIQERYIRHRIQRNKNQKEKLLDPGFKAFSPDIILSKLADPSLPDFKDHRYCLVFWARPTEAVKSLVSKIQGKLRVRFPSEYSYTFAFGNLILVDLWYVPPDNLHMTTMEITHSREQHEVESIISTIKDSVDRIVNYTYDHRVRLVKPVIGFDASALALSFVPAAGEALTGGRTVEDDSYTFTHLRRDLFDECINAKADVQSRYIIETSHLTVARFINEKDFRKPDDWGLDHEKVAEFIQVIEELNSWLENEYWPTNGSIEPGGEWLVGQEKGLDLRCGTPWYGGGDRVQLGRGY